MSEFLKALLSVAGMIFDAIKAASEGDEDAAHAHAMIALRKLSDELARKKFNKG